MATKLYLINHENFFSGTASLTTRGTWDRDFTAGSSNGNQRLSRRKIGHNIFSSSDSENSTTNPYKVIIVKAHSDPLEAQTITGTVDIVALVRESNLDANFYYAMHIYVTVGDTDVVRGTLLSNFADTTGEWTTTTTARGFGDGPQTLSSVVCSRGDRIVAEIGFISRNAIINNRTGSIEFGAVDYDASFNSYDSLPDLTLGATTDGAGYLDFSATLTWAPEPANSTCAGAIEITLPHTDTYDPHYSIESESPRDPYRWASDGAGEGFHGDMQPMWFKFTASTTGTVKLHTDGSVGYTEGTVVIVLEPTTACGGWVFDGLENGTLAGKDDPIIGDEFLFNVTAGLTYYILIQKRNDFGYGTATSLSLSVEYDAPVSPPPANDDCADAIALGPVLPVTFSGVDITGATAEGGEPDPTEGFYTISRSVWYTYTPTGTERVFVDVRDSDFDAAVAIYDGSCDIADLIDWGSKRAWLAEEGHIYYIQVFSTEVSAGLLSLELNYSTLVAGKEGSAGIICDVHQIPLTPEFFLLGFLEQFSDALIAGLYIAQEFGSGGFLPDDENPCPEGFEYHLPGGYQKSDLVLWYHEGHAGLGLGGDRIDAQFNADGPIHHTYPFDGRMYAFEIRFKCGTWDSDAHEILPDGEIEVKLDGVSVFNPTGLRLGRTPSTYTGGTTNPSSWEGFVWHHLSLIVEALYVTTKNEFPPDTWRTSLEHPFPRDASTMYAITFKNTTREALLADLGGYWGRYRYVLGDGRDEHPITLENEDLYGGGGDGHGSFGYPRIQSTPYLGLPAGLWFAEFPAGVECWPPVFHEVMFYRGVLEEAPPPAPPLPPANPRTDVPCCTNNGPSGTGYRPPGGFIPGPGSPLPPIVLTPIVIPPGGAETPTTYTPCVGGGGVPVANDPVEGANLDTAKIPLVYIEWELEDESIIRKGKLPINTVTREPVEDGVIGFSSVTYALADRKGNLPMQTFTITLADVSGAIKAILAAGANRFIVGRRLTSYIEDDENRRADLDPYKLVSGLISSDPEFTDKFTITIPMADELGYRYSPISLDRRFPLRTLRPEMFPNLPVQYAGIPVPIIYGEMSDEDRITYNPPETPYGIVPTFFVGTRELNGETWDAYMVCGHAIKSVTAWFASNLETDSTIFGSVRMDSTTANVGGEFLIPGYPGWDTYFGTPYNDIIDTNGQTERYTMIYARGGRSDDAVSGRVPITLNICGVEDVGDGSGDLITDIAYQIYHFLTQWVLQDPSYMYGNWSAVPSANGIEKVRASSFITVKNVHDSRIDGGYPGAWGIWEQAVARDILMDEQVSGDIRLGVNHHGQIIAFTLDERASLSGLRHLTDEHIHVDTFKVRRVSDEIENVIPYYFGPEPATGRMTGGKQFIADVVSMENYKSERRASDVIYRCVRKRNVADDVAMRSLIWSSNSPTYVSFAGNLSLLSLTVGQLIFVSHRAGLGQFGWTKRVLLVTSVTPNPEEADFTVNVTCEDVHNVLVRLDANGVSIEPYESQLGWNPLGSYADPDALPMGSIADGTGYRMG